MRSSDEIHADVKKCTPLEVIKRHALCEELSAAMKREFPDKKK